MVKSICKFKNCLYPRCSYMFKKCTHNNTRNLEDKRYEQSTVENTVAQYGTANSTLSRHHPYAVHMRHDDTEHQTSNIGLPFLFLLPPSLIPLSFQSWCCETVSSRFDPPTRTMRFSHPFASICIQILLLL